MHMTDSLLPISLSTQALAFPRLRMNYNFHEAAESPSQRLLNALEPGTVIFEVKDGPNAPLGAEDVRSCCMAAQKTYGGITQSKIDTMLKELVKNGATVSGQSPAWTVDTHQYGIKLKGEWNAAESSLKVTLLDKGFYVPEKKVWQKMDELMGKL